MPEIKYPSAKNIFLLCLAFIGLNILAELISLFTISIMDLAGFHISENLERLVSLVFSILVYIFIIGSLVRKSYVDTHSFFNRKKINPYVVFIFLLSFSGSFILFSEINYLFYYFFPMPGFLVEVFSRIFLLDSLPIAIMAIIIMPALFEEILFRGFILFGLRKNYSEGKSILISALFFGLVHLNPWQFFTAFMLGILFAWVALKTESIILPVLGHFLNNTMALVSSRYFESEINPSGRFELTPLPILITAIILTITGVYLFHQYSLQISMKDMTIKSENHSEKMQ